MDDIPNFATSGNQPLAYIATIEVELNKDFEGIELVGDLNFTDRIHLAAELGSEKKTI